MTQQHDRGAAGEQPDQHDVERRKAAAAAGATGNAGSGLDGDGPSAQDDRRVDAQGQDDTPRDPVTGDDTHPAGEQHAEENERRDPVG